MLNGGAGKVGHKCPFIDCREVKIKATALDTHPGQVRVSRKTQRADSSFSISRGRVEYCLKIAATVRHALDAHCLTDDAK